MTPFLNRIVKACMLDPQIFEEVEADRSAFGQAFAVVALSGMAMVAGVTGRLNLIELVTGVALGIVGWVIWSAIAYVVGARIFPEPQTIADWGELLRTTGFATAPGLIGVLGVFPVFTGFVTFVAAIWSLLTFTVGVRQALDYRSMKRAIGVCLVGWSLYVGILIGLMPSLSARVFEGASAPMPIIVRLDPDSGNPGGLISAYGTSLDSSSVDYLYLTDGRTTALLNVKEQTATVIRFKVPDMIESGRYTVVIRPRGVYPSALPQAVTLTVIGRTSELHLRHLAQPLRGMTYGVFRARSLSR